MVQLIRITPGSILQEQNWTPTLGPAAGNFTFADLLRKAGVADGQGAGA